MVARSFFLLAFFAGERPRSSAVLRRVPISASGSSRTDCALTSGSSAAAPAGGTSVVAAPAGGTSVVAVSAGGTSASGVLGRFTAASMIFRSCFEFASLGASTPRELTTLRSALASYRVPAAAFSSISRAATSASGENGGGASPSGGGGGASPSGGEGGASPSGVASGVGRANGPIPLAPSKRLPSLFGSRNMAPAPAIIAACTGSNGASPANCIAASIPPPRPAPAVAAILSPRRALSAASIASGVSPFGLRNRANGLEGLNATAIGAISPNVSATGFASAPRAIVSASTPSVLASSGAASRSFS